MNAILTLFTGVCVGLGVLILRSSTRATPPDTASWYGSLRKFSVPRRVAQAEDRDVVEAVAVWTEQLRDTISASTGLEQAIIATQDHAPPILRPHVQRLVAGIRYGSTEDALRLFADDVSHPTCDFVVAALITATQHQARDVSQLLTHLSECAREECKFYLRMWVSRARTRTATRLIAGVVVAFVAGLALLDPDYLSPFLSVEGVGFLCISGACFALALVMLQRLSKITMPARFLSPRSHVVNP
jgi:tight adherence protein B